MCGPLKGPSQQLLQQLNERLTALESEAVVLPRLGVLTGKVRGSFDALVEQLQLEGAIPDGKQSSDSGPALAPRLRSFHRARRSRR